MTPHERRIAALEHQVHHLSEAAKIAHAAHYALLSVVVESLAGGDEAKMKKVMAEVEKRTEKIVKKVETTAATMAAADPQPGPGKPKLTLH